MVTNKILEGMAARLRSVYEADAAFTLALRNDLDLTEFIPKVSGTLETQREWIKVQKEKEGDYFFIIEEKGGTALGTISVYGIDFKDMSAEVGRYISKANSVVNVEAAMLLLDFAFSDLGLCSVFININKNNLKIQKLWKKFGAVYQSEVQEKDWISVHYILQKEAYQIHKIDIKKSIQSFVL